MASKGYLAGTECGDGLICPSQPLKRWEMAVWLGRALSYGEPAPIDESRFVDVDAEEWWAPHVERFADLGITIGCRQEPLSYCPDRAVTRAQMATFFKRAFSLREAPSAGFTDTAGSTHESNIDRLAAAGITVGCKTEPLQYCPNRSVTRAQMATLLARALGLILAPSSTALTPAEVYARVAPSIPIVISQRGHGSGILIKGNYVLTNHHVVWPNKFETATVIFADGTTYVDVPVVATNPWADIAVLGPLDTEERPLALADGEGLPPGSELYLIGYPAEYEQYEGYAPEPTITRGILSRVRHWDGYDLTLLQTDAAITGGQSGGALVDSRGRVVGVSTWSWTDAGFAVATSATDDDDILGLMLGEDGFDFSFWERIDFETGASQAWEFDLGGAWDVATFFVDEITESIEISVDGAGEASLWLASVSGSLIGPDAEGPVASGSAELDPPYDPYFLEVAQWSNDPASYTLHSSASLLPYYDEDGVVLLAEDETDGGYAGVFDYFGDYDFYEIYLRSGESVVVWTDSIDADTALALYDPASNLVAEDDDSGPLGILGDPYNAQITYEAPSTGTYYLNVFVADGTPGGSYIVNAAILE